MKNISSLIIHRVKLKHSAVKKPCVRALMQHFQVGMIVHDFSAENIHQKFSQLGTCGHCDTPPLEMHFLFTWLQMSCLSYGLVVSVYTSERWFFLASIKSFFCDIFSSVNISPSNFSLPQTEFSYLPFTIKFCGKREKMADIIAF